MRKLNGKDIQIMTENAIRELKKNGLVKKNPVKIKISKDDINEAKERTIRRIEKIMNEERYQLGYFKSGYGDRKAQYFKGDRAEIACDDPEFNGIQGTIVNRYQSQQGGELIYDLQPDGGGQEISAIYTRFLKPCE